MVAVDDSVMYCFRLCTVVLDLLPEHFPYPGDIHTIPSQEGGSLKGPDAGLILEVMGIADDSCIHRVRLCHADLHVIRDILDDLRNHFRSTGSIGLYIRQGRVPDGALALPVMIQDHDGLRSFQKVRRFHDQGIVGIHHHQHGVLVQKLQRCVLADKEIRRVFSPLEALQHRFHRRHLVRDHDVGFLVQRHGNAPDADRGAQTVDIHALMAHDEKTVLILDQFAEGMGFDTGLDAGSLLLGVALSSVVLHTVGLLHHSLVTAASKGHIHGLPRQFGALCVIVSPVSDSDGQGDAHLIADIYHLHLLKDVKLPLLQGLQVLFLQDDKIFVLLQLADDGPHAVKIPHDLPVDHGRQQGTPHLFH